MRKSPYQLGSCSGDVYAIQNVLGLPQDGIFGDATQQAVMDYQSSHTDLIGDPLAVDGIVGPNTWDSLFNPYGETVDNPTGGYLEYQNTSPPTPPPTQGPYDDTSYQTSAPTWAPYDTSYQTPAPTWAPTPAPTST